MNSKLDDWFEPTPALILEVLPLEPAAPLAPVEKEPCAEFVFESFRKDEKPVDLQAAEEMVSQMDGSLTSKCGSIFFYDASAGYWKVQSEVDVQSAALGVLKRMYSLDKEDKPVHKWGSVSQVKNTCQQVVIQTSQGPLREGSPAGVIVFRNGTYRCKTHELGAHRRDFGATYCIEAGYLGPNGDCPPELLRVVETCYPEGSLPIIRALVRWVVDPTSPYGRYWHIIGDSGTGKGIVLSFCQSLLPYNLQSTLKHPSDLTDNDKLYQFVFGRRLVVCADVPVQHQKGDVNIFLESVENKPQTPRALFGKSSEDAQPMFAKFLLASTAEMEFRGGDGSSGHLRRCLFVRTNPKDPGVEDLTLDSDLNGDTEHHERVRSQAVSWALAMPDDEFHAVLADNDPNNLLRDNKRAARSRTDAISCWADECLVPSVDPHAPVGQGDLDEMFSCYREWCAATNVRNTLAQQTWVGSLRKTLGAKRTVSRWKAPANANGEREWQVSYFAGFQLRSGVWAGGEFAYHHAQRRAGGLELLGELEQAQRPKVQD